MEASAAVDRQAGNRLFLVIVFWFTLASSVELWWLDTPGQSITDPSGILIAAGRITGLVAGFLLLVQILLMSRIPLLERWIGANDLLIWHRELGPQILVLVLAHLVFTIFGYAAGGRTSVVSETWTMLTTFEDMISAFLATGILVVVGLFAIRAIRRRMPHEVWYCLHLTTYLVLLLSYGHQFAVGANLARPGFARWYWASMYAVVVGCLLWGRLLRPLALNLRHRFQVVEVVEEGDEMFSVYVTGRRLHKLRAQAGQYFRWRFLTKGCWWQSHPFSLSAAPNEKWLRLTVKVVGDHTEELRYLTPGVRVFVDGPAGAFTADRRTRPRALLIAGGSGIAPIRALLETLPGGTVVIYRASTARDLVFEQELDYLARQRAARVWYVLGPRTDPGPRRLFTPAGMRELVPDVIRRDVYLCGPRGMIDTSVRTLRRLRVRRRQIHVDPFEF
jgi:predicted ferric reductase